MSVRETQTPLGERPTADGCPPVDSPVDPPAGGDVGGPGLDRRLVALWLAILAAVVPFCWWGPGTDLDVGYVLAAGRSLARDGVYRASRPPGAPVHEAMVGLLDRAGGIAASNLGTLVMAIAVVVLVVMILRHERIPRPALVTTLLVTNPWFLIAATSTVDFPWALAAFLASAYLLRTRPGLRGAALAGIPGALAIGIRSSTILIIGGLALVEIIGSDERGVRRLSRAAVFVGVVLLGALVYIAPFLEADGSLSFAQNSFETSSLPVQIGRFLAKDLYLFGPLAAIGLVVALPGVVRSLKGWRGDWLVQVGLATLLISQLLYLRFPWKMAHLLPTVVAVVFLLGRALARRPRLLAGIVAAQVLFCFISIQIVEPDTPNRATGARVRIRPTAGMVVRDLQCRNDARDAFLDGDPALAAVWDCARPWAE